MNFMSPVWILEAYGLYTQEPIPKPYYLQKATRFCGPQFETTCNKSKAKQFGSKIIAMKFVQDANFLHKPPHYFKPVEYQPDET